MCGLTGVLLFPKRRSSEEWREIINLTTANMVLNEERGRDAAGIAIIQADGRCRIFKQPASASELITMSGYQQALATVGNETVCILGHTRMPTKGSRWRNANNHPLQAGHVVGIHNGIIANDDHIFAHLGLSRAGEVDSEVIFRLLDTVSPTQDNGGYRRLVQERINIIDGSFATLSVDLRKPAELLVTKKLRPLCIHYEKEWEALFFSSRYSFLRRSFGRSVITEALESGRGFYFNAEHLPRNGNRPVFSFDIAEKSTAASLPWAMG